MPKSRCCDCMNCKLVVPRTDPVTVKCSESVFKQTLDVGHPFINLERNCECFDSAEEDDNATHTG